MGKKKQGAGKMTDEEKAEECADWIKQKQKDEMKNKISFALKDPILEQGFEIICKNLAELEKENAELEKENAELKGIKDIETLIRANNDTVITLMQLNNMLVNQQLTKAKKLIKRQKNLLKGW